MKLFHDEELDPLLEQAGAYGAAATGEKVRWYQTILKHALGFRTLAVNGNHNDLATRAAMRAAGASLGFAAPSGYLTVAGNTALTRSALERIYRRAISGGGLGGAIRRFQRDYGLSVDGKVGPQTRGAMVRVLTGELPTPVRSFHPRLTKLDRRPGDRFLADEEADWDLHKGIIGRDDRKAVGTTVDTPNRWICQLSVKMPGVSSAFGGTGFLISPRHILTAAHVVASEYNDDRGRLRFETATSAVAIPGCDHRPRKRRFFVREPFGRFEIDLDRSFIPPLWLKLEGGDSWKGPIEDWVFGSDWDFAVLRLKKPLGRLILRPRKLKFRKGTSPFDREFRMSFWGGRFNRIRASVLDIKNFRHEDSSKWMALARNRRFFTAGYPGRAMVQMRTSAPVGDADDLARSSAPDGKNRRTGVVLGRRGFAHIMDVTKGQSGSPIWIERKVAAVEGKRLRRDVVGLATHGADLDDRTHNFGLAFSPELIRSIVAYDPQTFFNKYGANRRIVGLGVRSNAP